jgi:DNA-binding NarL/FixJ family response regulator
MGESPVNPVKERPVVHRSLPHVEDRIGVQIRLLIADQHMLLRDGLQKAFGSYSDVTVVGQAANGNETLRLLNDLAPNMVLLDSAIDKTEGFQTLRQIGRSRLVRTIIMASEITREQKLAATNLGASAVLLKKSSFRQLLACIRSINAGEEWTEPAADFTSANSVDSAQDRLRSKLTGRELDIVVGVAAGCRNREIAARLKLSEQTVKHYLSTIFIKTGVSNRLELALRARDNSIFAGISRA